MKMGSLNDYDILKAIGKGSYGEVLLIQHKKDRKQYALKKMPLQTVSKRERKAAQLEAKLLSNLKHPNIVSYKDSFENEDGYLYIVMGYAEGGDLYNRIREQRLKNEFLSEVQVVRWFIQICMALQYLHQKHILHRDLKTQNIFLTKTKMIKIGDLSIARVLEGASDMATTLIGTPYYMSPELFSNRPYNHKSDVWALGCCVYEMTTLKHAFNAKDMNALVYKILKQKMPKMPELYSSELCDLIKSMLHQNADKRPSVNRILRNPFIKKHIHLFLDESSKARRPTSARSRQSEASSRATSASSVQSRCSSRDSSSSASTEQSTSQPVLPVRPKVSSKQESSKLTSKEHSENMSRQGIAEREKPTYRKANNAEKVSGSECVKGTNHHSYSSSKAHKPEQPIASHMLELNHKERNQNLSPIKSPLPPKQTKRAKSAESTSSTTSDESSNNSKKETVSRPLPTVKIENSQSDDKHNLKASRESNSSNSPTGVRISSARERRRKEKQRKANELKESKNNLIVDKPTRTATEKNESVTVTDGESKRKGSNAGEDDNQFYNLLHNTLRLTIQDDTPPSTPPDGARGDRATLEEEKNKLSPVEELSESKAASNKSSGSQATTTDSSKNLPYSTNTPRATEISFPVPPHANPPGRGISQATLGSTGRLMDRIVALRRDCIKGLGVPLLHRAYELLDSGLDEARLEVKLIDLLGDDRFRQWAGKIWQLKFCEESIFKHCGSITAY